MDVRDTIRVACAPPSDFCPVLGKQCSSADLSLSDCNVFEKHCADDPCGACEAAVVRCEASGDTNCAYIEQHCADGLAGCCSGRGPQDGPGDKIKTCAPDADMCDQIGAACIADGLDPEVCEGFRVNVCPADRYMSCKAIEKVCEAEGNDCQAVTATCDDQLDGCVASKCHEAGTLTPGQAVALCYAYPWTLDTCDGEEPSASHCMSLMTWDECGITSCDWIECAEELALLGDMCPLDVPEACEAVVACDIAENQGW